MNASRSVYGASYEPQQSSTQAIIWSLTQTAAVYFTAVLQIIKSGFVNSKECVVFLPRERNTYTALQTAIDGLNGSNKSTCYAVHSNTPSRPPCTIKSFLGVSECLKHVSMRHHAKNQGQVKSEKTAL